MTKNFFGRNGLAVVALLGITAIAAITQCRKVDDPLLYQFPPADTTTYTMSDADFPNPERGFFKYSQTNVSNYSPLDVDELKNARTELQQADGGTYKIYSTLVFRYFILKGYTDKPLTEDLLNKINEDFNIAREAGVKLIPRFTYSVTTHAGGCPEGLACPPYGDAPKEIVLEHIAQLKPIFQTNADVIAAFQMGFIGIWGENYYTDFFGDASQNGEGKLLDENWEDRFDVLRALLDALPADRMVQVRYPQMKQRFVYGVDAPAGADPLSDAEAFTGSDKARIGMHNDCFISSSDDVGTYQNYGNSSSDRGGGTAELRAYASADNQYVVVGGETCSNLYTPNNGCEATGMVQTEMATMHLSYLNSAYNNDLNDTWVTGGCMDNIKKNLGYRFVLVNSIIPKAGGVRGQQLPIEINLRNDGYASPYNPRVAKLIMKSQANGQVFVYDLSSTVQKWLPGNINISERLLVNKDMSAGTYDLFLYLPDAYQSLSNRSEYAIRFANQDVWDGATGYNNLHTSVVIR